VDGSCARVFKVDDNWMGGLMTAHTGSTLGFYVGFFARDDYVWGFVSGCIAPRRSELVFVYYCFVMFDVDRRALFSI